MDGFDRRRIMAQKKITLTSIANALGVAVPTVSDVLHGKTTSRRIAQAIADAIGKPLEEVFPKYSQSPQAGAKSSGKHKEAA